MTLSKIILKINIDTSIKIGYFLIMIALILTGIFYQYFGPVKDLYLESNIIFGLSLFLLGELLSSFQYILQAKYFMIGDIYFFKVVDFEGLFGFIISIIMLLFLMETLNSILQHSFFRTIFTFYFCDFIKLFI